jgi:hypothetical protein
MAENQKNFHWFHLASEQQKNQQKNQHNQKTKQKLVQWLIVMMVQFWLKVVCVGVVEKVGTVEKVWKRLE